MDKNDLLKYREFHWNYFSLHADQRLKTFNFYLVVAAVLISGFVNFLDRDKNVKLACILPYLLTLISFIFWKLDLRTKQMISNSENAIKSIDDILIPNNGEIPNGLNIFRYDDYMVSHEKKRFFKRHMSYSKSFNAIFFLFGIIGFIVGTFYLTSIIICK
jgi:hypothetical protein